MKSILLGLGLAVAAVPAAYAENAVDTLLAEYTAAGGANFSADAGKELWFKQFTTEGEQRACTTCHGEDLTKPGKHISTGKTIEPLAPSANAKRLTDTKEIAKWFKRNCKWTVGRECTAQEKGDVLTFLRDQ